MSSCLNVLRSVTFLFNIIFWLSGVVIFGLGIWLLFDPAASDYFSLHSTHPGYFYHVAWFLIAAGAVIVLVGYLGCVGAWKMNQCALAIFCCIIVLAFFLELAAAITAYNKHDHVKSYVESSMYDTIRNRYSSETTFQNAFDSIQETFQCCGVRSYHDWLGTKWYRKIIPSSEIAEEYSGRIEHGIGAFGKEQGNGIGKIPTSCCNDEGKLAYPTDCGKSFDQAPLSTYSQFIFQKGCSDAMFDRLTNSLNLIVLLCVIFCAAQLLGVILSMTLCCCVNKTKY